MSLEAADCHGGCCGPVATANVSSWLGFPQENIPGISNNRIPEARKYTESGVHRTLYRFRPDDYRDIDKPPGGPVRDRPEARSLASERWGRPSLERPPQSRVRDPLGASRRARLRTRTCGEDAARLDLGMPDAAVGRNLDDVGAEA